MNFKEYLKSQKKYVDDILPIFLPSENDYPEIIHKAINYSVFSGGKRLRPILVLETAASLGCSKEDVANYASAVEFLHTYSLIHDDLPALDDDDFRRSKPTNHKVFGEDIAILAGDALLTLAFETIAEQNPLTENTEYQTPEIKIEIVKELSNAGGTFGMIGGQVIDLKSEGMSIDFKTLDYIHRKKTGALITACLKIGAIASKADDEEIELISNFGEKIGLLYQIIDDILDVIGDEKKLGKKVGSDEKNNKSTYPTLYGLKKSKEKAKGLAEESRKILAETSLNKEFFNNLIDFFVNRQY